MGGAMLLELLNFASKDRQLYCYGAGRWGEEITEVLLDHGIRIDAFIVSEGKEQRSEFGIPIKRIGDFASLEHCQCIVAVSSEIAQKDIQVSLREKKAMDVFVVSDRLVNEIRDGICEKNVELYNMGKGKRCFLLASGSTLLQHDLAKLKYEYVMTCSFLSLMPIYREIRPFCYVSPTPRGSFGMPSETHRYVQEWFAFLEKSVSSPIMVFDYLDWPYIKRFERFRDRRVYYLCQQGIEDSKRKSVYLLNKPSPAPRTAAAMMLKVAMYMGFSEIYFLGLEHGAIKEMVDATHSYINDHAYNIEDLQDYNCTHMMHSWKQSNQKYPNRLILKWEGEAFEQYHRLHVIAKEQGILIYNATPNSLVDEFEHVEYESLWK